MRAFFACVVASLSTLLIVPPASANHSPARKPEDRCYVSWGPNGEVPGRTWIGDDLRIRRIYVFRDSLHVMENGMLSYSQCFDETPDQSGLVINIRVNCKPGGTAYLENHKTGKYSETIPNASSKNPLIGAVCRWWDMYVNSGGREDVKFGWHNYGLSQ